MSLLEALIIYCVRKGIVVGDGEDSFRDFMPDAPDNVVVFHEYAGSPPSQFMSAVHRSVQIKVRGTTAENAKAKALQVCNAFRSTVETLRIDFTDALWGQVYVRQLPFKLEQDERDRVIYCFNLGITTNVLE